MPRSAVPWILVLVLAAPASGAICAVDDVPAATLLVPYFEQDLDDHEGQSTIVTVANTDPSPALANVTLWTDLGIPTLVFQIYLTGFDSQSFVLRDVFRGHLPRTADSGSDPNDTISNEGPLSEDGNFPGTAPPCAGGPPDWNEPVLDAAAVERLRRAHTGRSLPGTSQCAGADHGDALARGYLTIDVVERCSTLTPDDPRYWSEGVASRRNVLRGRVFWANPRDDFAGGESAVAIEACAPESTAGGCPFESGEMTFYGGFLGGSAADQREPLPQVFAADYILGGAFDGGTDLVVWREVKGRRSPGSCVASSDRLLDELEVVAFDEQENLYQTCYQGDIVMPIGGPTTCFPLAAQRQVLRGGNVIPSDVAPPFDFGWLHLDLGHTVTSDPFQGRAQGWVLVESRAQGRFNVLHRAAHLASGCAGPPDPLLPPLP